MFLGKIASYLPKNSSLFFLFMTFHHKIMKIGTIITNAKFLLVILCVVGCNVPETQRRGDVTGEIDLTPYPLPNSIPSQIEAYPPVYQPDQGFSYPPVSTITQNKKSQLVFEIDKPVLAGSTEVTGKGPANIIIRLVDVTDMGAVLSETTIAPDGKFLFKLDQPLKKLHTIGLQIGDLTNTDYRYEDFIYSDSYIDMPLIGVLLDVAPVVEK